MRDHPGAFNKVAFIVACDCFINVNGTIMQGLELIWADVIGLDRVVEGFNVPIILGSVFLYVPELYSEDFHGISEFMR
jgi:hypothetical protein